MFFSDFWLGEYFLPLVFDNHAKFDVIKDGNSFNERPYLLVVIEKE